MFIIAGVSGKTVTAFLPGTHYSGFCLMWSILISIPTFVDSMCVCLIVSHLQIQFNLHSNDFQAFPFCCDLSHNMWETRVNSGLKRISVREETIFF